MKKRIKMYGGGKVPKAPKAPKQPGYFKKRKIKKKNQQEISKTKKITK